MYVLYSLFLIAQRCFDVLIGTLHVFVCFQEQVLNTSTSASGKSSVAVRLAHGEAQLMAQVRKFLKDNGVVLAAFEEDSGGQQQQEKISEITGRRNRLEAKASSTFRQLSGTAFLIKNLPVGTTQTEVQELIMQHVKPVSTDPTVISGDSELARFGLIRVLVPPLGITAILQFDLPQQARLAYKALAYEPVSLGDGSISILDISLKSKTPIDVLPFTCNWPHTTSNHRSLYRRIRTGMWCCSSVTQSTHTTGQYLFASKTGLRCLVISSNHASNTDLLCDNEELATDSHDCTTPFCKVSMRPWAIIPTRSDSGLLRAHYWWWSASPRNIPVVSFIGMFHDKRFCESN